MARDRKRPPVLLIFLVIAVLAGLYWYSLGMPTLDVLLDDWQTQWQVSGGSELAETLGDKLDDLSTAVGGYLDEHSAPPPSSPYPAAPAPTGAEAALKAHFMAVGNADSILIQCGGRNMLVDAGESDSFDHISEYLHTLGVSKLDCIVATHPHSDHIGGMARVVEEFLPDVCYISPAPHTTTTYARLISALERCEVQVTSPLPGDTAELGGAKLTFVAPAAEGDYEEMNDWSLAFMLEYSGVRIFMAGDMEAPSERDVLDAGYDIDCDVLKVAHHGSNSSSTKNFLSALSPEVAIVTREEDDINAKTLERLTNAGAVVYCTWKGDLVLTVSGGEYSLAFAEE